MVLVKNYHKVSKFQPTFETEPYKVVSSDNNGHFLIVERESDGKQYKRHPDDLKRFNGCFPSQQYEQINTSEQEALEKWNEIAANINYDGEFDSYDIPAASNFFANFDNIQGREVADNVPIQPRRSNRTLVENSKYFNDQFTK